MPIPPDIMRVSMLGVGPGAEQFDVSFWLRTGAPALGTEANALAVQIRDLWQTNAATAYRALIPNTQRWSEIRLYSYPTGGPSAGVIGSAPITSANGTGTATAVQTPLQTAMTVSLLTQFAGRRTRGRMYLPASGKLMQSDSLWGLGDVTPVATATANFFTAVNALGGIGEVVVLSQITGGGQTVPVTSVRVDNKPDIQRRRANKLIATQAAVATVTV